MKRIVLALIVNFIIITSAHAFITFNQELDVSSNTTQIRGINFKPDGTIMYVTERNGTTDNNIGRAANIIQFSLSTPFDISTAKEVSNTRVEEEVGTNLNFLPHAIEFKPDGTRLFLIANTGTLVYQFDLSTAWDTSTISFNAKYNVTGENQLRTLTFKPDGLRMYVSGTQHDKLKEYILTNPWDITTSNVTAGKTSASLVSADDNMRNVQFNSSGTELYVGGNENNNMNKYTLSTAWDISTISSSFTAYTLGGTTFSNMRGFIFTSSFTRLYITDDDNLTNRIIEYVAACGTTITCENPKQDKNVVALLEAQFNLSKRIIKHNSLPIMHRIEWLRRHKNYDNLDNFQAEISFTDQRLAKLVDTIKPNKKRNKRPKKDDQWFKWNEGRIGIGKSKGIAGSLSRNLHSTGFAIGADKKKNDDTMYGYVFQFGTENVDIIPNLSGIFAKSYSLSMYSTTLRENHIFTDGIIGISHLDLDIRRDDNNNILEGDRYGEQIFGTFNFGKRINTENINFNPNLKIDLGYTKLGEYREENEFGTLTDVLLFEEQEIYSGFGTASLLFDKTIKHYEDRLINHSGRIEYVLDFSPDSDAEFYYANNTNTRYSLNFDSDEETEHNIRVGYGFDVSSKTGWSLISNFERFYVVNNGYINEIYFSAGYVPINGTKFALDAKNNNFNSSLRVDKKIYGFNLKFDFENDLFNSSKDYLVNLSIDAKY